jgi:hypothetical protein
VLILTVLYLHCLSLSVGTSVAVIVYLLDSHQPIDLLCIPDLILKIMFL